MIALPWGVGLPFSSVFLQESFLPQNFNLIYKDHFYLGVVSPVSKNVLEFGAQFTWSHIKATIVNKSVRAALEKVTTDLKI